MPTPKRPAPPPESADPAEEVPLPMLSGATSQYAELATSVRGPEAPPPPQEVAKGVVVFDLDGTILDDIGLISHVAGNVLHEAFGTPTDQARVHYLATTG